MKRRVIVPLDGTANAESALKALPDLCDPGDEVVLITVVQSARQLQSGVRPGRIVRGNVTGAIGGVSAASRPDYPVYAETQDQALASQMDELEDYLRGHAKPLEAMGLKVDLAIEISDNPAQAIADVTRRVHPTFLIMVRTTHPGIGQRLFGTVAQQVIRENLAPVMILPSPLG